MKGIYIFALGTLILMYSCGPNQQEIKNREKFIADSIKTAELVELKRVHEEKIEVGKSIKKTKLTNLLEELKSRLNKAERKLKDINLFQLGRSLSTKELQLQEQREKIYELESFITNVEKEISLTHLFKSYDFQETPKGTVEHLFKAAKSSDFSKVRHLLDPHGEFDDDAIRFCLVEMQTETEQESFREIFMNGRIIGDPKITGDKAKIEIAYGSSSDRLTKITLVQRMDKWYIQAF